MAVKIAVAFLTLFSTPIVASCFEDGLNLLQQRVEVMHHSPLSRDTEMLWDATEGVVRLLDFSKATVTVNNLGGQGPIKTLADGSPAPEEIRYTNLVVGRDVDLVVSITTQTTYSQTGNYNQGADDAASKAPYQAHNAQMNGLIGTNGQINAQSGSSVPLMFSFVKSGTNTLYVMDKFYISFSDIDERHGGQEKEKLRVDAFDKYYTNDDIKLTGNSTGANGHTQSFESSDFGDFTDNELPLENPTPTQLSHTVTFVFTNKSQFITTFSSWTKTGFMPNTGRNLVFSGISQLVFCQDPSTYLDFSTAVVTNNNLGGVGPGTGPQEIRYSNIATYEGDVLDFVVTADTGFGYNVSNASQNGLHGDFGHVNLFCGPTLTASEAYLTFTLVRTGTNDPVTVNAFAFVVFDFDQGLHEQQSEFVELSPNAAGFSGGKGYSSYLATSTSEVVVSNGTNGAKRFSASKHGTESDNPSSSQMLARETADKSVVFTFKNTASFTATFGITPAGVDSGRNFMFSGQDMYLLCD